MVVEKSVSNKKCEKRALAQASSSAVGHYPRNVKNFRCLKYVRHVRAHVVFILKKVVKFANVWLISRSRGNLKAIALVSCYTGESPT